MCGALASKTPVKKRSKTTRDVTVTVREEWIESEQKEIPSLAEE